MSLLLIVAMVISDGDSPSVRALRAMPNVTRESGTYEWTGREWVFRERKAEPEKPKEITVERYSGVYEWTGSAWKWTSPDGKPYWHDGVKWNELSTMPSTGYARQPTQSRPAPRGPQNRYGIQWAR